jgi:regulator of protease activity HflC (stomatin/prohibitin superfamily)
MTPSIVAIAILVFILTQAVKVLNEDERGVIFRLGRLVPSKGPGVILLIPPVDRLLRNVWIVLLFEKVGENQSNPLCLKGEHDGTI